MATTQSKTDNQPNNNLEGGTYEIIRNRLEKQTNDLRQRLDSLNVDRKEVFGAIETALISNDRINTPNYCIARDIIAIGEHCIFGYNVHVGLRSGITLKDVFAVYDFKNNSFQEVNLDILEHAKGGEKFATDFQNLYRYYKDAFFAKFVRQGSFLYMVFQLTEGIASDFKAFKWLVNDDGLVYVDNRSEQEITKPKQHEFEWKRVHRDHHRTGQHPHISILDRVFVETVGGDLTIKVEDNTDDGLGIYREDVTHIDQTLDDAEYLFADLDNLIVLKIRPYQEDYRYFVFNEKLQQVQRVDALADSGVLLPDGHGLIFPNGYYLQTGEFKIFDQDLRDMRFEQRIPAPNGEDFFYVFYNYNYGTYVLLHYNLIEQQVQTPIICHGFTLFTNGELAYFKAEDEQTKHHVVQIWQTPFVSGEDVPSEHTDSYLYKVGNKDIVKAMAECTEILTLANKDDSYSGLYADLSKRCTDVIDSYYWINKEPAYFLNEPLAAIRETATSAIEEYQKKVRIQRNTEEEISRVRTQSEDLFQKIKRESFQTVDEYVTALAELRQLRGEIISLKDLRYTDEELIEELEIRATENTNQLSEGCVRFLLQDDALTPYLGKIAEQEKTLESVKSAKDGERLLEKVEGIGGELELLIDIVSNLKIEDATQTTRIIDNISSMYASLNQVKAAVRRKRKDLMGTEAVAEFNAQLKLLDQGIINYIDVSDTPQKCDEYLTKLMVQVEELEGKFAEFDEFIETITEKREEIYNAFETRKQGLVESRNNRTASLNRAGERILNGIQSRAKSFKEVTEINAFFAADLMIDKVRDLIAQLMELEDTNKANALQTQLKTLKEEAIRQLRDKQDLFVDGKNVIQFGKHKFDVNVQPLDLTVVEKEGALFYHLTGTNYYEEIQDEGILSTREVWNQALVSENKSIYRAEYLAYLVMQEALANLSKDDRQKLALSHPDLLEKVKTFAANRYEEGYTKGIHDEDAAKILGVLLNLENNIDLLSFSPKVRALAQFYWTKKIGEEDKKLLETQLASARVILDVFPESEKFEYLEGKILEEIEKVEMD
jgi:hypothetical protein